MKKDNIKTVSAAKINSIKFIKRITPKIRIRKIAQEGNSELQFA